GAHAGARFEEEARFGAGEGRVVVDAEPAPLELVARGERADGVVAAIVAYGHGPYGGRDGAAACSHRRRRRRHGGHLGRPPGATRPRGRRARTRPPHELLRVWHPVPGGW